MWRMMHVATGMARDFAVGIHLGNGIRHGVSNPHPADRQARWVVGEYDRQ